MRWGAEVVAADPRGIASSLTIPYRRYSRDPSLLRLEDEARAARRGLWALPEAERAPPWEWRASRR